MRIRFVRIALLPALAVAFFAGGAHAGKFTVLHSFVGGSGDGASPLGGVAPAGGGSFYVATDGGGSSGLGTLTLLRKDGTTQMLHAFTGGSDGQNADGAPVVYSAFDGGVYGTTQFGGSSGCGTVYKYAGAYQQVIAFKCGPDAAFPFAGLVQSESPSIDLYGVSYDGGAADGGRVIYVDSHGNAGSSCDFSAESGSHPFAGITVAKGNLYTVTTAGGANNLGTVVEACGRGVLHNFAGGSDGATPYGTLLYYKNVLYGTTANGGAPNLGTVFKVNLDGSNYTVLHAFQGICCGNSDGSFPRSGLTLNKTNGLLYGTTINGGNSSDNGTVFSIDPNTGAEKVVHAFSGSDGAHPYGNLYIKKGKVYGTAVSGGGSNLGVVFWLRT